MRREEKCNLGMNLKAIFAFYLLISGFTLTSSTGGCMTRDTHSNMCIMCYGLTPTQNYKCVPRATDDHCLVRMVGGGICYLCEDGYAASDTIPKGEALAPCVKAEIPKNCVNPQISKGKVTCKTCENGFYPNFSGTACDSESGLSNCLWAARSYSGNEAACWRCKDGYLANKDYKCVEQKDLVGCASTYDGTSCSTCDVWGGYYFKDSSGKCSK